MLNSAKVIFYLIELINCYAAVYYSNFVFFYLKRVFGFGAMENLLTAAVGGFVYIFAAWQGGKLAERFGCIKLLYAGTLVIIFSLALGLLFPHPAAQIVIYCLWTAGVCCIWPALEALVSAEAGEALPQMVGIYNVTWAGGAALAYFTTGMLLEKLGMASLFWLPLVLTAFELALIPWASGLLKRQKIRDNRAETAFVAEAPKDGKKFRQMAWIANPFSYVAINTVIPLIPTVADKLDLSTGMAGIVCSLWMFARLAAFTVFWQWKGWHYRFRWLAGSCLLLIACFFAILLTQSLGLLLIAQAGFGLAIGLIYYSSLYYSMNVTGNQAANAGLHEAMIGAGLFAGPAVGAAALYLAPAAFGAGAWSVGGLLCVGFSALFFVRYRRRRDG